MRIPPDHRVDASPHVGLLELLAAAARRQSDGVLAAGTGLAVVLGAAALVAGPGWRALALVALAASAFGGWGILDRTVAEHRADGSAHAEDAALSAAGVALLVGGAVALALFLFLGFGHLLDGVIH
jgi:hypothetical protein